MSKSKPRIAIIDLGINNLYSIHKALDKVGCDAFIVSDNENLLKADALVLPGVGAYDKAMKYLEQKKLINSIKEFVTSGKYVLGICLGMQLLMDFSEEFGIHNGLGLIKGSCKRFSIDVLKVPHIRWNKIYKLNDYRKDSPLYSLKSGEQMYFIHSYYVNPHDNNSIISKTNYNGFEFCSAIQFKKVIGVQFHPEKSALKGIEILNNFKNLVINDKKEKHKKDI